jgi:hypothetical protein
MAKKKAPQKTAKKAATKSKAKKTSAPKKTTPATKPDRVVVRNVNVPGYQATVDACKYEAMRAVLVPALPKRGAGLTQAEMYAAVKGKLPEDVFPGQLKAEWWVKCVQLDLEARGAMKRLATKPLRWVRV